MSLQGKKDEYLTTREAADYLGFSETTVRQYVHRGLIRPFQRIGKSHIFTKQECMRYLRERKPKGKPKK